MDTVTTPKSAAQDTTPARIVAAMSAADRTKKWTAEKTGIAYSTFKRKLLGHTDFTVGELARIGRALGVRPRTLLPAEFQDEDVPALVAA